jgi:hypothetical protein
VRVLARDMQECLEVWKDQKLDEEIRSDARHSGYTEQDAVEILRRQRVNQRSNRAAS